MALCPHMPTVRICAWDSEARHYGVPCLVPPCQLPPRRDDIEAELAAGRPGSPSASGGSVESLATSRKYTCRPVSGVFSRMSTAAVPQHARGRRGPTLLTAVFSQRPWAQPSAACPSDLEAMANQELEQYTTLRQSSALQSELRILAASRRRALPAIRSLSASC